jgi:hypothetical protein
MTGFANKQKWNIRRIISGNYRFLPERIRFSVRNMTRFVLHRCAHIQNNHLGILLDPLEDVLRRKILKFSRMTKQVKDVQAQPLLGAVIDWAMLLSLLNMFRSYYLFTIIPISELQQLVAAHGRYVTNCVINPTTYSNLPLHGSTSCPNFACIPSPCWRCSSVMKSIG